MLMLALRIATTRRRSFRLVDSALHGAVHPAMIAEPLLCVTECLRQHEGNVDVAARCVRVRADNMGFLYQGLGYIAGYTRQ